MSMMKKALTILAILLVNLALVTGCGVADQFCDDNHEKLNGFCTSIVGYDKTQEQDKINKETAAAVKFINERLDSLKGQQLAYQLLLELQISHLTADTQERLNNLVSLSTSQFNMVYNQISDLSLAVAGTVFLIDQLQAAVTEHAIQLAELGTYINVVEVIDFCGDAPNKVDEIGLRMSDGSILVYFESNAGTNRYLATLERGKTYATTDGTGCTFQYNLNGEIL